MRKRSPTSALAILNALERGANLEDVDRVPNWRPDEVHHDFADAIAAACGRRARDAVNPFA
jgi:hypothetical protein